MKRSFAIFLCLILVTPILVFAQTVKERIDLDFVDGLRKRGDIDLALDYLKIIEKMASPELKINIPLEIARTQLAKAIAEPDKTRRQKLYLGVMVEIKKFIKAKIVLDQLEADFAQEDGISNEINARKETLRKIEANTNK